MKTIFLVLAFGYAFGMSAQEIQLNEEPKVAQLYRTWVSEQRAHPAVEGWRVQVMASTDRLQVEQARTRFRTEYPDISAEWIQEKPYYKLRVGAFRSKQEALALIQSLEGWAGAYAVKDNKIHPRDFLSQ